MKELQRAPEMRIYADRQKVVTNNLTALWDIIIVGYHQQEELRAEKAYDVRAADYDSIWLLKTLQKVTAGVNKTTITYYSLFNALK